MDLYTHHAIKFCLQTLLYVMHHDMPSAFSAYGFDALGRELPSNLWYYQIPNLNVSGLVLQLSLSNPLKPGVKLRMKM